MKKIILILLPILAQAQVDVFKREIDFVSSQRQTLEKQLVQVKAQRTKQSGELNKQLDTLHQEKARLNAELESTENEAAEFSRLAKKQLQSESALTDRLSWTKTKNEEMIYFIPQTIKASEDSLTSVLNQQGQILQAMSQVFTAQKSYTNKEEALSVGSVFHVGPFARFLNKDNQWSVLSLTDSGYYTETNESSFGSDSSGSPFVAAAFIQLPFNKTQSILKEKNTFNRVMDTLPAIFLALVFFAIGWIFLQLAKS